MINEAIVLAGGFGTRLQSVVKELPKPMAPILGRPFLEYLFDHLIDSSIQRLIISTGYKSEQIKDHFGSNYKGTSIIYSHETEPLGTGGAIKKALQFALSDYVLITNGDTLFLGNIGEQLKFHLSKNADVTLALKSLHNFDRYGSVKLNEDHRILGFLEKKSLEEGLINVGMYIFNKNIFEKVPTPTRFSLEQDFFAKFIDQLSFYGYISDKFFLDIGIPEDYERAQSEFAKFPIGR